MECPRCGEKLYYGTRFCPSCGLVVEELVQELVEQEGASKDELDSDSVEGGETPPEEDHVARDEPSDQAPEGDAGAEDEEGPRAELEEDGEEGALSAKIDAGEPTHTEEKTSTQEDPNEQCEAVGSVESQEGGQDEQDGLDEPGSDPLDEGPLEPSEDDANDSATSKTANTVISGNAYAGKDSAGSESGEDGPE